MEFQRCDQDATSALQETGECPANRVHEAAPRFQITGKGATRSEEKAQTVPYFRILGIRILVSDAKRNGCTINKFILTYHEPLIANYSAFQFEVLQILLE